MRLIHLADVHLGLSPRAFGTQEAALRERLRQAFQRCLAGAAEASADVLLISGDLFESNRVDLRTLRFAIIELQRFLARCPRAHLFLLPGTHDALGPDCVYGAPEWGELGERAHVFLEERGGAVRLPELDLTVHGVPHTRGQADAHPLLLVRPDPASRFNVAMVHASVMIPGLVDQDSSLVSEGELANCGMEYVALGHWHRFADYSRGEVRAAYPGTPELTSLDGAGKGGYLQVDITPAAVEVIHQPTRTLQAQTLSLTVPEIGDTEGLRRRLEGLASPELVLDVQVTGVCPATTVLDLEGIAGELGGSFFRLRLSDQTKLSVEELDQEGLDERLIGGRFAKLMLERLEQADEEMKPVVQEALRLGLSALLARGSRQ